ncbi:hypothetical protein ACVBEH_08170 [Roseateles sp. GG27B]
MMDAQGHALLYGHLPAREEKDRAITWSLRQKAGSSAQNSCVYCLRTTLVD